MTKAKKKKGPRYGLSKKHTRRNARDFVDQDYLDKLTERELDWLDKFNREYYHAQFTNTSRDKHKTKKLKRECYSRNNSRQRDTWNQNQRADGDVDDTAADIEKKDD